MKRRHFLGSAAIASLLPEASAAENDKPLLRFGLIADAQYVDAEVQGERHYRSTPEKLKQAVEELRAADLAFTLHLGDFIDRDFKSFDTMLPLLAGLGHPVHHLLGNHDYSVGNTEKGRVTSMLGMPHDYYTFRSGGIRFVMLDTNDVSIYKEPAGSTRSKDAEKILAGLKEAKQPGAEPYNGGLSEGQLAWLERELSAADAAKETVIVCGHHPLLPAETHQAWDAAEVVAVLEKHPCVLAYFNGHNHAGDFAEQKGIAYVTFRSMLYHPGINAFSVIEVYPDRIAIQGHGREESRILRRS